MSDPVLAIILIFCLYAAVAAARYFKTIDRDFWRVAFTPTVTAVVAGVVIRLAGESTLLRAAAIGVLLTVAAIYSRLTGEESEPIDALLIGGASGGAAALPLVVNGGEELQTFAACVLAGAVAGYGITLAAFHVGEKGRQVVIDAVTAAIAIAAAALPLLAARAAGDRAVAYAAAAVIPLVGIGAVFQQWSDVRSELREEANLGFIAESDVRSTAHPFLRLGRAGWTDPHAHREFVRVANRIALRKRQQRGRSSEMARLYQLEIIKLRMQLQAMSKIDLDETIRRKSPRHDDELPSDTMARQ